MPPVEKLSKCDLEECVRWLETVARTHDGLPLPKTIAVEGHLHGKLWRCAIMHRREAGKLRVMNAKLYWRSVPIEIHGNAAAMRASLDGTPKILKPKSVVPPIGEEPGKHPPYKEGDLAAHGERTGKPILTPVEVADFVMDKVGTGPLVKRLRIAISAKVCELDVGRVVMELVEGDAKFLVKLMNLAVFAPSVQVSVVDLP